MLNGVPPCIGAAVGDQTDLFWPSREDKGLAVGSIAFSAVATEAPGFVKERSPYGLVWRRISSAEIQQRRTTTLWK